MNVLNYSYKNKLEIFTLNLITLLYLFRTTIPFLKYPFLLVYILFFVYLLIRFKRQIISNFTEFIDNYLLIILLSLILVISFLLSNKLYLTIFKDVVNMIILLSIFFMSKLIVSSKIELKLYVSGLANLILIFAVGISILRLLDLLNIFSSINFTSFSETGVSKSGNNFNVDRNFALLPIFFGMIGVFYIFKKTDSTLKNVFFKFSLLIFSLNIILTGSRRGLILLLFIILIFIIDRILALFKKDHFLKINISISNFFLVSLISITLLLTLFFSLTPNKFRDNSLIFLGTKDITATKSEIAVNFFKYISGINKKKSYQELFDQMWTSGFYPEDPESGWGSRIHKTVFPLTGKNVEIVPPGAKGYFMDHSCNGSYYSGNDNCESYSLIVQLHAKKNEHYKFSVYCFISDSTDIDDASLLIGHSALSLVLSGNISSNYNLKHKGEWQKLEFDFISGDGSIPVFISFWKRGVKDFAKMNGYIIFAYPSYQKISGINNISHSTLKNSLKELRTSKLIKNQNQNEPDQELMETNNSINQTEISVNIFQYKSLLSILPFSQLSSWIATDSNQFDDDPIRNIASRFLSEDTVYYPYKSNIVLNTLPNSFISDRVTRWEFACKIFFKEYNLKQKLIGNGFSFLNWYGYFFDKDKTKSDWPHNPFLSILLYSGILGLIIYCYFIFKVFSYYFKYIKEYSYFFILFLITFFFSFFSGGSPFDPPIMGFFVILPFFIHSIHKKIKPEQFDNHVG
jgi:hypothetical protein